MYRATITTAVGRLMSAAIVSGAVALAACSDSATAPETSAIPTTANAITVGPPTLAAYITVRAADTTGATLKETGWMEFTTTSPLDTVRVLDNSAKDLDPAVGYMKVKVAKAQTYRACWSFSEHYRGDYSSQTFPQCTPKVTSSAQTVNVGVVYAKRAPTILMLAKNEFGVLIGGATYTVEIPDQNSLQTVSEGGYYDESSVVGNFTYGTVHYPHPVVKVCEVSPPPKHELTSTKCFSFETKFGLVNTLVFKHQSLIY
jgi:hypothetical protein